MYNWISEHEYLLTSSGTFPELHSFLGFDFYSIVLLYIMNTWYIIWYCFHSIMFFIFWFDILFYMACFLCIVFTGVAWQTEMWGDVKISCWCTGVCLSLNLSFTSPLSFKKIINHLQYFVFDRLTNWHSLIVLPSEHGCI